jgi:hypothetical protein
MAVCTLWRVVWRGVAWRGVGACVYGVSIDCVLCIYCVVQEIDRYCTLYTVHFFLSLC